MHSSCAVDNIELVETVDRDVLRVSRQADSRVTATVSQSVDSPKRTESASLGVSLAVDADGWDAGAFSRAYGRST